MELPSCLWASSGADAARSALPATMPAAAIVDAVRNLRRFMVASCSRRLNAITVRLKADTTAIDAKATVLEYALAELLEDGEIQRHVWRVRREYATRRDRPGAAVMPIQARRPETL